MPALSAYEATLQSLVDGVVESSGVPGAVVGIIRGDESTVVSSGLANAATGVDATVDTVFQIGSVSKVYTATVAMQLVHAGLVELDEPVRGALHEFRVRDEVATLTITPRHLLSHTSGIEGDHFLDCGRNPDALWRYVSTLEDVGQIHPPDDLFSYCNAGYVVLGRLVEEQTGDHFSRALFRRLLKPIGAEMTFTTADQAITSRVAAGHQQEPGGDAVVSRWVLAQFPVPMGGIVASAGDVLKFAKLHLSNGKTPGGKQIVPAKAVAAMQEGQIEVPGSTSERGLGWLIDHWDDATVLAHDGDNVGQRSFLRVFPEHDAAIVVLTNSPVGDHVLHAVLGAAAPDLLGLEPPALPDPLPADQRPDPSRCNGIYERMHQRLAIAESGEGTLRMTVIPDEVFVSAGITERTQTLTPIDDERWLTTDPANGVDSIVTMIGDDERPDYVMYRNRVHRRLA